MEKVRVYELAKELNTTSKRLMEKLAEININVKNHMSFLEEHELEALYNHIGVIRHDEKSEADEKKAAQSAPVQPRPEIRKEARNAPRIIRTTEIIINTSDKEKSSGSDSYRRDDTKGSRGDRKSEYIRQSDDNSGLLAGFVRKTSDDYLAALAALQKERQKKQAAEASAKAPAADSKKTKDKSEENQAVATKSSVSDKEQVTAAKKAAKTEEQKTAKSAHAVKEDKDKSAQHADTPKADAALKHEHEIKAQDQMQKADNAAANISKPDSAPTVKQQEKTVVDADRRQKPADRQQTEKTLDKPEDSSHGDRHNASKAETERQQHTHLKQQSDKHATAETKQKNVSGTRQSVKSFDMPKPDFAVSQKEETNYQRGESKRDFIDRDLDRDIKREQRKDSYKSAPKQAKKLRPTHIGLSEKKGVSEILSEDFMLDEFYDDAEARIKKNKAKKEKSAAEKQASAKPAVESISIPEKITVKDLAEALKKAAPEVIKKLMSYGVMATINQEIDFDTAAIVAEEFGVKAEKEVVVNEEDILFDDSEPDNPEDLVPRPPVVVVMGHVDHGKTSLLDAIRSTHVTESEAGGITQHIGASTVNVNGRSITFLDTPGHEAFTSMRARGAQVTDIAILVVAADDGVMPQTVEAINHAKAANVSIIVAINKIDKPDANPERVKQELMQHGLVPEEWGGDVICVNVSAKKKQNIDQLLEMVLLTADLLELKANPKRQAKGTVIEAKLDKHKGPLATVLVQRGILKVGDSIITGTTFGRIRSMTDDKGNVVKSAGPSTPVEILGLPEVPEAGELFYVVKDEKLAKQLVEKRKLKQKEQMLNKAPKVSLDDLFKQIQEGKVKELNLIVKADVQGSVEALKQSFEKLSNDEVRVKVIHGAVGTITETDVTLASVSDAIIIGFNVRPMANVVEAAKNAGVDIRLYNVIYNAIEDIEAAMKGMLEPTYKEVVTGHAEVRQLFKISGVGTVAGCYVLDGKIVRNGDVRVIRDGIVVYEGKLASLKRFKDDVREVVQGFECGLSIEKFNDIKEMDIIETYIMEKVKR